MDKTVVLRQKICVLLFEMLISVVSVHFKPVCLCVCGQSNRIKSGICSVLVCISPKKIMFHHFIIRM